MLNLMTLWAGDAEKGIDSGWRRRSISRRSTWTWCSRWHLGFIFSLGRTAGAPLHRSRRRSYCSLDCSFVLTAARAAATPFLHRGTDVQARSTRIGHEDMCWKEETLDELKRKKMMWRKEKLMTGLGFLPKPDVLYL
jgi:hypothetical protein